MDDNLPHNRPQYPHVIQITNQDGDGNQVEQSVIIYNGPPPIEPDRFVKAEKWDWSKWDRNDLLRPLLPKSASVPFVGRELELTGLNSLMAEDHGPIGLGVVTGRGGAGKTRLAQYFGDLMLDSGWDVRMLGREQVDFWANKNPAYWSGKITPGKTLLVIDYAAGYSSQLYQWLMQLLPTKELMQNRKIFLRILLLDREASFDHGWLKEVCGGIGDCFYELKALFPYPVWSLSSVSPSDAFSIYTHILDGIGQSVPSDRLESLNDKIGRADWNGNPLYIMMAAICHQHTGPDVFNMSRPKLAFKVAELQAKKINGLARAQNIDGDLLNHLSACLTLRQGIFVNQFNDFLNDEITQIKAPIQGLPTEYPKTILNTLKTFLSYRMEEQSTSIGRKINKQFIAPLLPDVIGEAFALRILSGNISAVIRCYRADPLAAFEAISRIVQDFGRVDLVDLDKDKDLDHIHEWLDGLLDHESSDLESLKKLSANLSRNNVFLRDFNAEVDLRLVAWLKDNPPHDNDPAELAQSLLLMGTSLSETGRREEALSPTEEAVELYRRLAEANPAAFLPDLASSLNNLGVILCELGMQNEADLCYEEMKTIQSQL